MAVVADRVILKLEAKLDRYEANVRRAEARFDSATKNITASAKQMETQIRNSTAAVGNQLRVMAGTFAAAFSAREVARMADGYTRFINQLKVAGVEGDNLARIQGKLLEVANRNGVELESIGTLYSRAAQNQKELGASQQDLINLTSAVAASLKISGTSATEASGALLQLGQALGSPRVQAEEFNSLIDVMGPLLREASKHIDGTGNSLSGLVRRVKDVQGPGVSNIQLFQGITAALGGLEAQASKATLTIGGAFTVLNNALGVYIGSADDSLSATERVSAAIITLSENLDTVAAALGVISAILLGRFAAGMIAASASTGIVSTAMFAMTARAAGAATAMEALALTGATAGRTLLAAFGGPVGVAIAALSVGIYYLTTQTGKGTQASQEYLDAQSRLKKIQDAVADATDALSTATGKARAEALANAKALRQETVQYLANARAALIAASAKAAVAQSEANLARDRMRVGGNDPRLIPGVDPQGAKERVAQADADVAAATANAKNAQKQLDKLDAIIKAPPAVAPVTPTKPEKPKKTRAKKDTGPSADDIARRFQEDFDRGTIEYEAAQAAITDTLQARNDAERSRILLEEKMQARAIEADDNYTAAQKKQLLELNRQIAVTRMEAQHAAEREQEAADILAVRVAQSDTEQDILQGQLELANTTAERKRIELRILDAQYEEERLRLENIANNERANEVDRQIARERLRVLGQLRGQDEAKINQRYEGVGARYLRQLNSQDINEQLDEVRVRGLQSLEDKITDVTAKIFKMGGAFGDVANQIISDLIRIGVQRSIIEPLANALFGGGSGGGGGGGGLLGGIISGIGTVFGSGGLGGGPKSFSGGVSNALGLLRGGRASGGHVAPGGVYPVNEGGKIEGFQPAGSGKIIPLGSLKSPMRGGGGGDVNINMPVSVSAPGANAQTVALIQQTLNEAAPTLVQTAQRAVMKSLSRPRIT